MGILLGILLVVGGRAVGLIDSTTATLLALVVIAEELLMRYRC